MHFVRIGIGIREVGGIKVLFNGKGGEERGASGGVEGDVDFMSNQTASP
jgi:hypothetical protein